MPDHAIAALEVAGGTHAPVDCPFNEQASEAVLDQVFDERQRQHAKFRQQNWPDGTGTLVDISIVMAYPPAVVADAAKEITDGRFKTGRLTWKDILAEEFFEALAETDPGKLRTELIQVAGVAVAWVEAIDRRVNTEIAQSTSGGFTVDTAGLATHTIHDAADDLVRATHG